MPRWAAMATTVPLITEISSVALVSNQFVQATNPEDELQNGTETSSLAPLPIDMMGPNHPQSFLSPQNTISKNCLRLPGCAVLQLYFDESVPKASLHNGMPERHGKLTMRKLIQKILRSKFHIGV